MTDEQLDLLRSAIRAEIQYARVVHEGETFWESVHLAEHCDELWQLLKLATGENK